ncbi:Protein CBR-SRW-67 [Caenorhabditis briggsae]|uniref:Protein CBR-SRW-67 n=1 Tax=Caenorhabditis briggsae TaxID=6238 RepID=A8XS35_CAEBR|nr:Protein CBR-SRW-67 [Caenorhabditis briggsae]CAP35454.1 Protein CBR-SRW-67 [Caenorhabditis briggsae]
MSFNYTDADFGGFGFTESTINTWIAIADFISSISMTVVTYEFYLACGGVVANVFHLLILLQKSMRSNSVNVVMIGIAACDLFSMGFTVFSNLLVLVNSNPECWNSSNYSVIVIQLWGSAINDDLRRMTPWLGILMAVIRFLIIKNSLNPKFQKLSDPMFSVTITLITWILSTLWSMFYFLRLSVTDVGIPWEPAPTCTAFPLNYTEHQYDFTIDQTYMSNAVFIIKVYLIIDGILKIIPTIMFPILTFLLIRELKAAQSSRQKISAAVQRKEESTRSDHTTSLVILMTVTFMTGEGLLGICYVVQGLITSYPIFVQIVTDLSYIFGIFVALNSSTHCLICLTVSSQYRRTVKSLFLCESCKPRKASSKVCVSAKASVSSMAPVT